MKLGLINSVWFGTKINTLEAVHKTREIGFDTIDVFTDLADSTPLQHRQLKEACDDEGLPIISVATALPGLIEFNKPVREFTLGLLRKYTDLACYLEARNVEVALGEYIWEGQALPPATQWTWAVEAFKAGGEYAASQGIEICLEMEPFQYSVTRGVEKMVELLDAIDNPAVKANVDCSHLYLLRTPARDILELQGRIGHVHLSDCDGVRHGDLPPGRGSTPLKEYLKTLNDAGFNGSASIELEYSPDPDNVVSWVTEAYVEADKIMKSLKLRA